jgi:hypothetical protein
MIKMSNALGNLKLIAAKRPVQMSPVVQRRTKVAKRISEQIELAKAAQDGSTYSPTKQRKVKDAETGESKTVQVAKRVKSWAWTGENGKLCVSLRYGAKVVELAKGKSTVEVSNANDLVKTLETLKQAVESGELDAQIESVATATRAAFKKK